MRQVLWVMWAVTLLAGCAAHTYRAHPSGAGDDTSLDQTFSTREAARVWVLKKERAITYPWPRHSWEIRDLDDNDRLVDIVNPGPSDSQPPAPSAVQR
jgi:hypothetical protein